MTFYRETLVHLVRDKTVSLDDAILVVCGGRYDIETLRAAGFRNVTISSFDPHHEEEAKPYRWSRQDAEALTFADNTFDWCFVYAGLHHCQSPHKALIEMCRVGCQGVVAIEARDSMLMRIARRLGLTADYEITAIIDHQYKGGGIRDLPIPNYVYRWTEREVIKTIESAFPHRINYVEFRYGMRYPSLPMSGIKEAISTVCFSALKVVWPIVKRQGNEFGIIVRSGALKPWMTPDGTGLRPDYHRSVP